MSDIILNEIDEKESQSTENTIDQTKYDTLINGFRFLHKLPLKCDHDELIARPSFSPNNSNTIIISTNYFDTNPGVYKYNIENNNLEMLIKYDGIDVAPEYHGQFIDYNNNTLHILDPLNESHITIDLTTKTINTNHQLHFDDYPQSVQTSSIKGDEIHIVSNFENHFTYDCKNKIFIRASTTYDKLNSVYHPKLLYNETEQQLMILGGAGNDNIYCCNIKEPYEWKLMNNIKMPHCVGASDASYYDVLLFGDVITVLYFDVVQHIYDIWCMDLFDYKWYKSKYNVPSSIWHGSYIIKSNDDNNIHVLDFHNQKHLIVNIHNLFSDGMIKQRRKHFEILVIGYVKGKEKNMTLNIPDEIKQLILLLFPLFN